MSISVGTITTDMKSSFRLVKRSFLSYFLAMLGLSILVGIIGAIIALPSVAIAEWVGPSRLALYGAELTKWAENHPYLAVGGFSLLILPVIGLICVVIGALYGISNELVKTGDTRAEHAFQWFKTRFFAFAAAGIIIFVVTVGPPALLALVAVELFGPISGLEAALLNAFTFLWMYVTLGVQSMILPSVAEGKGVVEAVKESIGLSISRFDRVFGIWTAYSLLSVFMLTPLFVWVYMEASHFIATPPTLGLAAGVILGWTVIAGLLMSLVVFPSLILAQTRVYAILTGKLQAPQEPNIPVSK